MHTRPPSASTSVPACTQAPRSRSRRLGRNGSWTRRTGSSPRPWKATGSHLRDYIVPYVGALKLSQLTVPVVREFMDRLRADGRSPAMIKRVVGDLGSILADAQERGLVAQNVVRSLSRKKRRAAERRQNHKLKVGVDIPSPAEIKAIVAHLLGRWRPLLLTAIFSGLRSSELRGLQWSDVDLKKAQIHVRQRADKFKTIGSWFGVGSAK
jgi:integrase